MVVLDKREAEPLQKAVNPPRKARAGPARANLRNPRPLRRSSGVKVLPNKTHTAMATGAHKKKATRLHKFWKNGACSSSRSYCRTTKIDRENFYYIVGNCDLVEIRMRRDGISQSA